MSSAEGMPLPPGVRPDEVRAWACTYLEEGGGDAARKRVSTASPEGGSKLAAWNRGLAVAVNPATRQVQFGRDIQPGWTLRQCRTDKAGESCRFLRDRLRKPVSLPRTVLTFSCAAEALQPASPPPVTSETVLCQSMDDSASPMAKANRLRLAVSHPLPAGLEIAVQRERRLVQFATAYQRGWQVRSCPDGREGDACRSLQRYRSVTFPEAAVTRPCPPSAKTEASGEKLVPLMPDPRPWQVALHPVAGVDRIIDLDTIEAVRDDRREVLRFFGVNGPECKGHGRVEGIHHYENRCLKGEWGANQAREALVKILTAHHNTVYLAEHGHEGYGRLLATVFVKNPDGSFLNVNAELIRQGWGMFYMIAPDEMMLAVDYTPLHLEARRMERGLYGAYKQGVHRYQGPFYFPSYHPKASSEPRVQDPAKEYTRLFNIGVEPVDLRRFYIVDAASGDVFRLPHLVVPIGFGVQIFPASGVMNGDPRRGPLIVNLSEVPDQNQNLSKVVWRNDSALILKALRGDRPQGDDPVITVIAGSHGASYLPDGFK